MENNTSINLTQSYRVPRAVHDVAMNIVGRISNRLHKDWKPRVHEGALSYYHDFQNFGNVFLSDEHQFI